MKQFCRKLFILLPVILVLLAFAWAIWLFIGIGANDYLKGVAEKNTRQQLQKIMKEAERNHGDLIELDNAVKKHFSGENAKPQLIILDKDKEEIYHSSKRSSHDQLVSELKQSFLCGEIKEIPEVISIDGEDYEAVVYTFIPDDGDLSTANGGLSTDLSTYPPEISTERYYIVYQRIGDATVLLKQIRIYIIYITIPMIIIAAFVIFLISSAIERRELALERQQAHERMLLEAEHIKECLALEAVHEKERILLLAERERAEETAKAQAERERLFRDISHDLRTPLVSIIGYAEGIRCGIMKDAGAAATVIAREGNRMQRLIESSLMLSKLDSHAWQVNKMPVTVDELIDEQIEVLMKLDDEKKLVFEKTDDAEDYVINTDPDLLIRIIQNIVSDCMRYAESEVRLILTVGDNVTILISDDGPGILKEDLPHLFEPYYKGDGGKYGIGLSVVASAARYLGGEVSIKNKEKPDHGAIFTLILPR